jgi:hypothetical protein
MQFSPLRFSTYAKDLEQAILGIATEQNMPPRGWPIRTSPQVPDNVTQLPTVELTEAPKTETNVVVVEPLKRNVTGASNLGASVQTLIEAIKNEVNAANQELVKAAGEVRTGINTVKGVAKALRTEADDIKSSLGQFSNGGPE